MNKKNIIIVGLLITSFLYIIVYQLFLKDILMETFDMRWSNIYVWIAKPLVYLSGGLLLNSALRNKIVLKYMKYIKAILLVLLIGYIISFIIYVYGSDVTDVTNLTVLSLSSYARWNVAFWKDNFGMFALIGVVLSSNISKDN